MQEEYNAAENENQVKYNKKAGHLTCFVSCGRWDLNPHDRIDHKILSLARLPIPTLPRTKGSIAVFAENVKY